MQPLPEISNGFYKLKGDPVVPDIMLSLGVQRPDDFSQKQNRSYLTWEMGKLPEVCLEIVSNQEGDELTLSRKSQQKGKTIAKKDLYAQLHIPYYVVFDPLQQPKPPRSLVTSAASSISARRYACPQRLGYLSGYPTASTAVCRRQGNRFD